MNAVRRSASDNRATAAVVASGIVALAVAMGIGRFAFTPLLPLMMRDGTLSAAAGAEWAAANYGGYLVGALTASWFSGDPRRGLLLSLFGVALTTLAVAWTDAGSTVLVGAVLRAAAGRLQRLGAGLREQLVPGRACPAAGAVAGRLDLHRRRPGHRAGRRARLARRAAAARMAVAGAWGCSRSRAPSFVWAGSRGRSSAPRRSGAHREASAIATDGRGGHLALVLCYGIFGFGYIVPATFLPAMARQLVADPLVFGLTWPVFGLAAAVSVAAAARWLSGWPRRRVWALAHGAMALGTALPLATQALWALTASAVLVGGTFMVATMAGLQLAREQLPANPTPLLARMTAAFAAGQIAGPLLVRALGDRAGPAGMRWPGPVRRPPCCWCSRRRGCGATPEPSLQPRGTPHESAPFRYSQPCLPGGRPARAARPAADARPRAAGGGGRADQRSSPRRLRSLPAAAARPALLRAVAKVGETLRYEGALDPACANGRSASWRASCPTCSSGTCTCRRPRPAGTPQAALAALEPTGRSPDGLRADLALARTLARELIATHRVTTRPMPKPFGIWGEPITVELLTLVGYFAMVCWLMNVARTPGPS